MRRVVATEAGSPTPAACEDDVALKLGEIGRLDAHAGKFAEAGVDSVDRLAAGHNPFDRSRARGHAGMMGGVDGDRRAAPDRPPVGKRRLAGAENDGHSPLHTRAWSGLKSSR